MCGAAAAWGWDSAVSAASTWRLAELEPMRLGGLELQLAPGGAQFSSGLPRDVQGPLGPTTPNHTHWGVRPRSRDPCPPSPLWGSLRKDSWSQDAWRLPLPVSASLADFGSPPHTVPGPRPYTILKLFLGLRPTPSTPGWATPSPGSPQVSSFPADPSQGPCPAPSSHPSRARLVDGVWITCAGPRQPVAPPAGPASTVLLYRGLAP